MAALWSMSELVTPKNRTPPTPQNSTDGSSVTQSGRTSEPLALICHPRTVMWSLCSTSIAPFVFLLIVPTP